MRVGLISGASRGIGKAIALELADRGFDLLVTGRDEAALLEVCAEIKARGGGDSRFVTADLENPGGVEEIHAAMADWRDQLDVLVNNAGVALSKPFGTYDQDDWDRVMNINARAPFFLTQACLPLLQRARPGYIVNICSVVSKKGYPEQSVYAASKHALLGLTKSIANEVARQDIRVHAILPGAVNTEMVRGVRPDIDTDDLISPDEVASVVGDLISMRGNAVIDEIEIRRKAKPPWA